MFSSEFNKKYTLIFFTNYINRLYIVAQAATWQKSCSYFMLIMSICGTYSGNFLILGIQVDAKGSYETFCKLISIS